MDLGLTEYEAGFVHRYFRSIHLSDPTNIMENFNQESQSCNYNSNWMSKSNFTENPGSAMVAKKRSFFIDS
jgi:hypothetical protein